jgi:hypothetical protein
MEKYAFEVSCDAVATVGVSEEADCSFEITVLSVVFR